jgi:hypothetical protein
MIEMAIITAVELSESFGLEEMEAGETTMAQKNGGNKYDRVSQHPTSSATF